MSEIKDLRSADAPVAPNFDLVVAGLAFFEIFLPTEIPPPAPGTETLVDARVEFGLGGILNPATTAAAAGLRTAIHHPASDSPMVDTAIVDICRARGIRSSSWPADAGPAVSFVHLSGRDRAFSSFADFRRLATAPAPPRSTWLHVPGLRELFALGPKLRAARAQGTKISLSSSWAPQELARFSSDCPCPLDLIVANQAEVEMMFGSLDAGLRGLGALSTRRVISMGRAGLVAADGDRVLQRPAEPIGADEIVDTVGAGDALVGGMLAGLVLEEEFVTALDRGQRAAGLQLRTRGGLAPTVYPQGETIP